MDHATFAPRVGFAVIATDLPSARRLVLSLVRGQALVTLIAALLSWAIGDSRAALSAVLGGAINAVASLAMAALSFGRAATARPERALRALYAGEALKVAVTVVLFVVVLKTMRVVPWAMLGTYVAAFVVFWVVLAKR
jgi:ATP synthase protein I